MSTPQPPAMMRTLLGLKEPDKPGHIVVWDTAEVTVGRAPENDVVLEDSDASRQHALFVRTAEGHQVQDLGTSNGTRVNGEPLSEGHLLQNKDVVQVGEVQITFIQTRKDPHALGLEVSFASSLKGFTNPAAGVDPGATTLGLETPVSDSFEVGAVGDFAPPGEATPAEAPAAEPAASAARDLDLEFNDFVPGGSLPSATNGTEGRISLQLEIDGLTPDLRRLVEALEDKQIELPALRIRVKRER